MHPPTNRGGTGSEVRETSQNQVRSLLPECREGLGRVWTKQGQWGQRGGDRTKDYTTSSARGSSVSPSSASAARREGLLRAERRPERKPGKCGTDPGVRACSSPRPGSPAARLHRSFLKSLHAHLSRKAEVSEGEADGPGPCGNSLEASHLSDSGNVNPFHRTDVHCACAIQKVGTERQGKQHYHVLPRGRGFTRSSSRNRHDNPAGRAGIFPLPWLW